MAGYPVTIGDTHQQEPTTIARPFDNRTPVQ